MTKIFKTYAFCLLTFTQFAHCMQAPDNILPSTPNPLNIQSPPPCRALHQNIDYNDPIYRYQNGLEQICYLGRGPKQDEYRKNKAIIMKLQLKKLHTTK